MSIIKRAYLYISRKIGKTIILFIILVIICSLVLICMSVGRAAGFAATDLRQSLGGYFKLEYNVESSKESTQLVDDPMVDAVKSQDGIKAYNGLDIQYMLTNDIMLQPGRFTMENDEKAHLARFLSNTDSQWHEYFYTNTLELLEGRHIAPDDHYKAVISQTLADMNGIGIGDAIRATISKDYALEGSEAVGKGFDFEIVGLFGMRSEQQTDTGRTPECDILENFIFVDTVGSREAQAAVTGRESDTYRYGATFFVTDPGEMDEIVERTGQIPGYDWDGIKFIVNNKAYETSVAPLEKLSGLINTLVLVIVVVSIVLLSLVLTLWMRDRVHEIGIYLSIGISKFSIMGQHILECLLIAIVAFLLSWGISGLVASRAADFFMQNIEVEEPAEIEKTVFSMNDPVELTDEAADANTEINVQVDFTEFMIVVGVGVLIIVVSTLVSSILVIRMKPKDILSTMS